MVRYKCSECNHAMCGLASSHCFHKDNYLELLTPEMIQEDAGYICPLNIEQNDYVPLKKEMELREQGKWKIFCERAGLTHLLKPEDYEVSTDTNTDTDKKESVEDYEGLDEKLMEMD